MRHRLLPILLLLATPALALDRWIPIAGSVNNFRTDTRVFNPSQTKDIQVRAVFLPANATDNNTRVGGGTTFTVGKRQMRVFDDVVASLFNATGIGAILLVSADEFHATSRIYATVATGTLGQFSLAESVGNAQAKGVLLQLESTGTFRTNIGAVNVANAPTTVTWYLYDKHNAIISSTMKEMPPYGVAGPTNMAGFGFSIPTGTDLSDAWVSYSATNPIFAYGSVIDNSTTDPTFVPMLPDSGAPAPQQPTAKTFDVSLRSGAIDVTPDLNTLREGDEVTLRITSLDATHGFQINGPNGSPVLANSAYSAGATATRTFTISAEGTYSYFCTLAGCTEGHEQMFGTFTVGEPSGGGPGY